MIENRVRNLPVDTQTDAPNPENLTYEAKLYQQLQFWLAEKGRPRTDSGRYSFTSPTSGITYDTDDDKWQSFPYIYNKGEEGMMNLIYHLYGKLETGEPFILSADVFNTMIDHINGMINGDITVYNSLHLDGKPSSWYLTQEHLQKIISGEIKVGDADTLDGFHASYFATKTYADNINTKVENILNGTTTVPKANQANSATNSSQLGGRPASDYALKSDLSSSTVSTYSGTSAPASSLGKNGDIYVLV